MYYVHSHCVPSLPSLRSVNPSLSLIPSTHSVRTIFSLRSNLLLTTFKHLLRYAHQNSSLRSSHPPTASAGCTLLYLPSSKVSTVPSRLPRLRLSSCALTDRNLLFCFANHSSLSAPLRGYVVAQHHPIPPLQCGFPTRFPRTRATHSLAALGSPCGSLIPYRSGCALNHYISSRLRLRLALCRRGPVLVSCSLRSHR